MSAARPETGATREGGDRSTGATPGQIKQALDHWCTFNDFRPENRWAYEGDAEQWAASFVPPGTVIALAEHVTTAADREAIGRALRLIRLHIELQQPMSEERQEAYIVEHRIAYRAITDADLATFDRLRGSGGEDVRHG